jgi:hypothetical protein
MKSGCFGSDRKLCFYIVGGVNRSLTMRAGRDARWVTAEETDRR